MACHPSGARRSSPPAILARSRRCRPENTGTTTLRTGSTVDRASGAQKIVCLSKVFCGSAAKRQPPFVPEIVSRAIQPRGSGKGSIVLMVFAIAAQPLPGNVHRFCLLEVGVGLL